MSEKTTERPAHRQLFKDLDECKANEPEGHKGMKVFKVAHNEKLIGFTWAPSAESALAAGARTDGWTAGIAEPKPGGFAVTKTTIAAKLADFNDSELAELGLSRKKSKSK